MRGYKEEEMRGKGKRVGRWGIGGERERERREGKGKKEEEMRGKGERVRGGRWGKLERKG